MGDKVKHLTVVSSIDACERVRRAATAITTWALTVKTDAPNFSSQAADLVLELQAARNQMMTERSGK